VVFFAADLQRCAGGEKSTEVAARNYRELVTELCASYPDLTADMVHKYALAIDGAIIQTPLLETFDRESELVFIPRMAGG
jgi:hypothetical protein